MPRLSLGLKGLNTDTPAYATPPDYFNAGKNMRPKDGSLQAVPQAVELMVNGKDVFPIIDGDTPLEVSGIRFTKYIPDGFSSANLIVTGVDINGIGRVRFTSNVGDLGVPEVVDVGRPRYSGGVYLIWMYDFTYGTDVFVFNSICIVNPKSTQPLWFNANTVGSNAFNPFTRTADGTINSNNWIFTDTLALNTCYVSSATQAIAGESVITFDTAPTAEQLAAGDILNATPDPVTATYRQYLVYNVSGNTVTVADPNNTAKLDFPNTGMVSTHSTAYVQYPYTAGYMTTFAGRMIAMNLRLYRNGALKESSPIEFAWSQPLSQLQSLAGIVWTAAATNSAGNDYLTESPGTVLCSIPLGEYLVTYKEDQVYKSLDTGAPNYYVSQPLYTDDGIIGPRAAIEVNESRHFFVGNNGIWMHQGGIEKQNISRGRVEEFFYRGEYGVDLAYKNLTFCYHNQLEKEVWICYRSKQAYRPASPDPADIPGCNYALCYNYQTDVWYWRSLGDEYGTGGVITDANYITDIQDVLANGQTWTLAAAPDSNFANITVPNGLWYFPKVTPGAVGIYEEDGYVQFDSRDLNTTELVKNCNGIWPHANMPVNIQLKFSNNIVDTTAIPSAMVRRFDPLHIEYLNYKLDYRETGRYMHFKISLAGLNNTGPITIQNPSCNPSFTDMDISIEQRGRR